MVPISVFVSRKLSRLFVRQGFTPLFDVPVKIQNPEEPLGTHVFTAMEFQNEGASYSLDRRVDSRRISSQSEDCHKSARRPANCRDRPIVPLPDKANAALDRIEIPQDVVEQISELLTPGSSLIISDYGISRETGKDTDFIVVTH